MHLCAPAWFEFCSGQIYNRLQTYCPCSPPSVVVALSSSFTTFLPLSFSIPYNLTSHLIPALCCHLNALIQENSHFSMLWIVQPEKSPFIHGCENSLFLLITPTNYWSWKGPFFCYEVPDPQLTLPYVFTLDEIIGLVGLGYVTLGFVWLGLFM